MGREVGSWMRDVWQDAREFRHCRKASSGRDARRWDDHTCTLASRSVYTDGTHGVGAGNGVKGGDHFFREVSYCSHYPRFDTERDVPDVETSNWRAVCGKTASTVRREGRRKPSLPLSGATSRGPWVASSQELLAMTGGRLSSNRFANYWASPRDGGRRPQGCFVGAKVFSISSISGLVSPALRKAAKSSRI